MQVMWISESTGRIRTLPITIKTILIGFASAALFFMIVGVLMNLVGLRIAIEQRPDLARAMGGVITVDQQKEIEDTYREKLVAMGEQLNLAALEFSEIRKIKDKYSQLATPKLLTKNAKGSNDEAVGGPFKPNSPELEKDLHQSLDYSISDIKNFRKIVNNTKKDWEKEYVWLEALPSSIPILGDYKITSTYGMRIDPFLGRLSQHEGLDFSAPMGTLISASGKGVVYKTGFDKEYGNFVELKHQHGYRTIYAHASEVLVKKGQEINRGDPIARVGNSGRSTGPHLHYEVIQDGGLFGPVKKLDPNGMLIGSR
jgi:murein DD-endopeptidase MepM/ murein hydrolase activator NlpD